MKKSMFDPMCVCVCECVCVRVRVCLSLKVKYAVKVWARDPVIDLLLYLKGILDTSPIPPENILHVPLHASTRLTILNVKM